MGALRAVELADRGMRGLGRVFELYRRGRLTADDEVALVFCPESLRPLSEPLVNLRLGLVDAHRAGLVTRAERIVLTRCMKRLERSPTRGAALRRWWSAAAPDVKADDARLLLRALAARGRGPGR
jgi:hypothetical protein